MKLTVIGAGYIGLITAACFADMGNEVICVDPDEKKIDDLDHYRLPVYEPGLEDLIRRNCMGKRLFFSTNLAKAVQASLICYLTLSPPPQEGEVPDIAAFLHVAREIGRHLNDYKVIVNKSAVPVGTVARLRQTIAEELAARGGEHDFDVVSDPEFIKQGTAIDDFMKPDRVVIGCDNDRVAELMKELYAPFVRTNRPIIIMDVASAELIKYAANAFLATKISFINELANICAATGADINAIRQGLGSDSRIGNLFLFPGLGYGGLRFSQGIQELIYTAKLHGYQPRLLEATEAINRNQRLLFIEMIRSYFRNQLQGRVLGVWGLAFKPWTDDIREAPSLTVVQALLQEGARIKAYDPQAVKAAQNYWGGSQTNLTYAADMYEAAEKADALIINTDWTMFRTPDFERLKSRLAVPVIFDGRNLYNPARLAQLGFEYFYIGCKKASP
ncbi:MAG: UDP-glucose/GDP-mannose dehydrogenase family protein [Deltaproteobacteria bacterium]|nr:UDP-glucose/GDP-mannose dehydrogenase family protein [Deltaproteobacteria bacterium]